MLAEFALVGRHDGIELFLVVVLALLNGFFALVEQMQSVDTAGVAPLAHPIEQIQAVAQRLRADAVTEVVDRDANQRPAPAVQDGLYLVPKVIE